MNKNPTSSQQASPVRRRRALAGGVVVAAALAALVSSMMASGASVPTSYRSGYSPTHLATAKLDSRIVSAAPARSHSRAVVIAPSILEGHAMFSADAVLRIHLTTAKAQASTTPKSQALWWWRHRAPTTTTTTTPPKTKAAPTTTTTTVAPTTTTTTTTVPTTTTTTTQPSVTNGVITTGNSKANCIELNNPGGVITDAQLEAITAVTGVTYNCVETYENPAPQWADWVNPWPFRITSDGWDTWVAENPNHQVVLGVDLIPNAITNDNDPLTWEQPCDAGNYDQYATQLAKNLVAYGAGNTVIRLGIEANGGWEVDYVGQTLTEQQDWAKCYDNEVTAMRAVAGAHFLFVWNPNTCTNDLGLTNWYPGNAYVDIIGADAYDLDCNTLKTVAQEGWASYYIDSNAGNDASLSAISAFAASNAKPMSIPEWGEVTGYSDDPAYVQGIASVTKDGDFSFQAYFDCGADGINQLGSDEPLSTTAFVNAFG